MEECVLRNNTRTIYSDHVALIGFVIDDDVNACPNDDYTDCEDPGVLITFLLFILRALGLRKFRSEFILLKHRAVNLMVVLSSLRQNDLYPLRFHHVTENSSVVDLDMSANLLDELGAETLEIGKMNATFAPMFADNQVSLFVNVNR